MIKIDGGYTDFYDDKDEKFPYGKAVGASAPGNTDGTPWRASFFNDIIGARQAIFKKAFGDAKEPSGKPDDTKSSDMLDALLRILDESVTQKDKILEEKDKILEERLREVNARIDERLKVLEGAPVLVPVGGVVPYFGASLPGDIWLWCDGAEFDAEKYPVLYELLGKNTTPDTREAALVGAGKNATSKIAAHDVYAVGEFKDDQHQSHTHSYTTGSTNFVAASKSGGIMDRYSTTSTGNATGRTGSVTRGKRLGCNFIIRAK